MFGPTTLLMHLVHRRRTPGRPAGTPADAAPAGGGGSAATETDNTSDTWSCETQFTEGDMDAEFGEHGSVADPDDDELLRSLGMTPWHLEVLPPPKKHARADTGTQPPPYLNLFWRQLVAAERQPGRLTAELLAQQGADFEPGGFPVGFEACAATNGEWLRRFKALARRIPVNLETGSLLGEDLDFGAAGFMRPGAFDAFSALCARTAGGLATDVDSISDAWSRRTELTEADLEAELGEHDGAAEPDVGDDLWKSLGMAPCFSGEPLLPPPKRTTQPGPGAQPPPFCNLFWRQIAASQQQPGRLTRELLAQQDADFELGTLPTGTEPRPVTDGEWLGHFKAIAKSVPIRRVAATLVGEDLGSRLAGFMGLGALDAPTELHARSVGADDLPSGERVIGSQYVPTSVSMGKGRAGFELTEDASVSTPGHWSRSHPTGSEVESQVSEVDTQVFSDISGAQFI